MDEEGWAIGTGGEPGPGRADGAHAKGADQWVQWSDEAEEIFFNALAASSHVTAAAAEAGFSTPTVYRTRPR
ncbi:hypothetical protein SH584_01045 [Sphingomonas sp. LY29]|uniref:hypothetical protein n=1 Tax=Sphingomonas sp. LY29 TaxID=3095341 RepID=UPI002D765D85|nr:hypothetical protein [Sphingomonas sp. LY29]WRP26067.1 hypothetical protein SH584_01045 [Sphingomonas sp. LY29]